LIIFSLKGIIKKFNSKTKGYHEWMLLIPAVITINNPKGCFLNQDNQGPFSHI
jgi:hypothetical protein